MCSVHKLLGLLLGSALGALQAQTLAPAPAPAAALDPVRSLQPPPRGDAARDLPIILRARSLRSQPDLQTVAEGDVEFRRGGLVISADRMAYDTPSDRATASGQVRIEREGVIYRGTELQLSVQRFEGWFLQPEFEFLALGAGGRADRIDFLGSARSRATNASYTSCRREDAVGPDWEPDWVLKADSVRIDLDANEGVAEGAVLRFLGTPILALPVLSFPLGDTRKSGWLPPSINIDNRSGIQLTVPWYWNIAPQRDATFGLRAITRRGFGVDSELRYLEPAYDGSINFDWLPADRVAGRSREALYWLHEARLAAGTHWRVELLRVSDDDWWKDFPDAIRSLTVRLLPLRMALERPLGWAGGEGLVYARTTQWQVLQSEDSVITSPYQRVPQVGLRLGGSAGAWEMSAETEFNRFTLPRDEARRQGRATGDRFHLLGAISRPWRQPGWWVVPKLRFNAAAYLTDDRFAPSAPGTRMPLAGKAQRVIPSFSIDAGLELERNTRAFGRALRQTLEPRLLYVNTPYRAQDHLPNYDSRAKDFNVVSVFTDNAFSGIDRVSDSHQITAGMTTRLVDEVSGAEALRVGLVQRYLLRTQRIAPQADGTPDGAPLTQRFSDALLVGSSSVLPNWTLDGAVQYSPDIGRSVRSILGARYSPGPFRTVGASYRFARGLSEQAGVGWQWPVYRSERSPSSGCGGTWYSVGRVSYSVRDKRITDSLLGIEYDAGCWIGRFVAERLSTGQREATTRLLFQLELIGLSRLGSNPLKVLRDNIAGYRLLRDERGGFPASMDADNGRPAPSGTPPSPSPPVP